MKGERSSTEYKQRGERGVCHGDVTPIERSGNVVGVIIGLSSIVATSESNGLPVLLYIRSYTGRVVRCEIKRM
jgi:hypothetical protein